MKNKIMVILLSLGFLNLACAVAVFCIYDHNLATVQAVASLIPFKICKILMRTSPQ